MGKNSKKIGKACTFYVPEEMHKKLKILAIKQGVTMSQLIINKIKSLLEKQEKNNE